MFKTFKLFSYFSIKQFIHSSKNIISKINPKQISIPLILTTSFILFKNKHSTNTNTLHLSAEIKTIELDGMTLNDGEMKEFKYGSEDYESILIIKYKNKFYAVSNYCPHSGSFLHTGTYK